MGRDEVDLYEATRNETESAEGRGKSIQQVSDKIYKMADHPPLQLTVAEKAIQRFMKRWQAGLHIHLLLDTCQDGQICVSSKVAASELVQLYYLCDRQHFPDRAGWLVGWLERETSTKVMEIDGVASRYRKKLLNKTNCFKEKEKDGYVCIFGER